MKFNILRKDIIVIIIICLLLTSSVYADIPTDNSLKQLEEEIFKQLYHRKSNIQINYSGPIDNLENTLKEIFKKDVYLNSTITQYQWNYSGHKGNININIDVAHIMTYEEELAYKNKVKDILKEIITRDMNIHEKVKAVNDWIVLNSEYDTTLTNYSPYDLLFKGTAVCNGYALLTYEMFHQLNIPVKLITGTSKGQNHIWNLVKVGNYWFHLDTTWNDPIPNKENIVFYDYYLLSDKEMSIDHLFNNDSTNAEKSYYKYLLELIALGNNSYKYEAILYDTNLDVYFDENTASTLSEFKEIILRQAISEPSYITVRYKKEIFDSIKNNGLAILYKNDNVDSISYSTTNDRTGNYEIIKAFISYTNTPKYLSSNILNNVFLVDDSFKLGIKAVYKDSVKDITEIASLNPINKDVLSYNNGTINFHNVGTSLITYKYGGTIVTIPVICFNELGFKYICSYAPDDDITVKVFDKFISFDSLGQPPIIENGRTLVPFRAIFYVLGLEVDWDEDTRTVTGYNDNTKIVLEIGSNIAYVNGKPVPLDVPAKIINSRTVVPIRFISESLDRNVEWDSALRRVYID